VSKINKRTSEQNTHNREFMRRATREDLTLTEIKKSELVDRSSNQSHSPTKIKDYEELDMP